MKEMTEDRLDSDKVSSKLIELEDRSQRNNFWIDSIAEDQIESWYEYEEKVLKVIKGKLEIQEPIEIDRCHRMGNHKRNHPRTIIFKWNKFKDKQKILQNARNLKDTEWNLYLQRFLWRFDGTEEVIVGAGSWALPAKQDHIPKLQKYYCKR